MLYKNPTQEEVQTAVVESQKGWQDFYAEPASFRFENSSITFNDLQSGEDVTAEIGKISLNQMYQRLAAKSVANNTVVTRSQSVPNHIWNTRTFAPNLSKITSGYLHRGMNTTARMRVKNGVLRAFLSETYTPVDSTLLMELFFTIPHLRIPQAVIDSDAIKVTLLTREYDEENFGSGVVLGFDNIGLHSVELSGMLKRFSCDNSLRVEDKVRFYHRPNIMTNIVKRIGTFYTQAERVDELYDVYQEAADTVFTDEDFEMLIAGYKKTFKFSDAFEQAFMAGIEKRQTLQAVVDGFTQAAHTVYPNDISQQNYFEDFATSLLTRQTLQ